MDLIPKPDQIVSAASNVAHTVLYGGLADLRTMPRTLIDDGMLRELYHYRPVGKVKEVGDPVLLVTPLAAPSTCFDLRRGCSLVEHLVAEGRPTYLVEYGEVSFKDRNLGLEHWIDEVIPEAVRHTSVHAGGRPVHVVGWSLGGLFAVLTAADRADLPIASLTLLGTPFDVAKVPMIAPLRPLLALADRPVRGLKKGNGPITRIYQAVGGAPKPLVRWAFQLSSAQKLVTKPLVKLRNLDDTDFLAQIEAVDAFISQMYAYPGRTFGQLYHRFVKSNDLRTGSFELDDRRIELAAITAPVLIFGGLTDGIAPIPCVRAGVPLLTGAPEVRFEAVPGGHLGMLTGRAARGSTWRVLDEWLSQWASDAPAAPARAAGAKKAARTATPREAPAAKKAPAAKRAAVAKKAPAEKASRASIGANPNRRYGSGGSRSLAR